MPGAGWRYWNGTHWAPHALAPNCEPIDAARDRSKFLDIATFLPNLQVGTVFDVGANIGTTSIPAVLSEGFASAVAIEPEPENVRVLRLNVLLNDLDERITVLPVAVSDAVGESELVLTPDRGGKHWLAADQTTRERKRSGRERETLTVKTVTVDRLAETGEIDVERTGLMWIDAEAHEGHILAGATALLERGTPLVLVVGVRNSYPRWAG